ncbi:MAG: helix-turn-helix domain-containing protein, partial [Actinomycetota bacterium]|nr:helix-turn-helix domain-containing protein [Actinomycetota bacterium]
GLGRLRAVLGPTVPWPEASRSVARAVSAWRLHAQGAFGPEPLVRADEHLLALLLAADPYLTRDLVRRRLHPLHDQPVGVRRRAEQTLRAWLDAHGDVSAAAAALGVHPQTVRYRLTGLRELFGDVLDDPVARLELALALQAAAPDDNGPG